MPLIRARELTIFHVIKDGPLVGKISEIGIDSDGVFIRAAFYNRARGRYFKTYQFKRNQLVEVKSKEIPRERRKPLPIQRPAPAKRAPQIRRGGRNRTR
jgi:hypothetical protein